MSLNTAKLKTDLKDVYTATYNTTGDKEAALDAFLDAFTGALEAYIKTAQVVYENGLNAGVNPVTGVFNGHIE